MIMLAVALTGCKLFGSEYDSFQVRYTSNLQLLLGEEWHDDLIEGTAEKSNGKTVDVTSKMKIDTSEYNKDQVGKYKIYFEFADTKLSYEVEVVSELTNATFVTNRLYNVMQNSLVAKEGVLSFDASMSQTFTYQEEDFQINQYMYYRECDGVVNMYYKWEMVYEDNSTETYIELWYTGNISEGIITIDYNDESIDNEAIDAELADFDTINISIAEGIVEEIGESVSYIDIEGVQLLPNLTSYNGTLTKNSDIYTLSVQGEPMATYSNNKLMSFNGINFAFDTTNTIPTAPVVE